VRKAFAVLGLAFLACIVVAFVAGVFATLGADFWSVFGGLWILIGSCFASAAVIVALGWLFNWCMTTLFDYSKPSCTPGKCYCKNTCVCITQDEVPRA